MTPTQIHFAIHRLTVALSDLIAHEIGTAQTQTLRDHLPELQHLAEQINAAKELPQLLNCEMPQGIEK